MSPSPAILSLPKAELHLHLEGALSPELIKRLAKKNNLPDPEQYFAKDGAILWQDFYDFLKMYDVMSDYLRTEEDLYEMTYDYLEQSHLQGSIYVELTVSPQHAANLGIDYRRAITIYESAIRQAEKDFGIKANLIIILVRHSGLDACMGVLDDVIKYPSTCVVGIGLAGDEANHPGELFKDHYAKARAVGLGLTVHSGEWSGPAAIAKVIDALQPQRISHGVRASESAPLLQRIRDANIHLEICPISNIKLGVYPDYQQHPIHYFIREGINFSLNTDDPPFFGTSINHEYLEAAKHCQLNTGQLLAITHNAIASSFASGGDKTLLLAKLNQYQA